METAPVVVFVGVLVFLAHCFVALVERTRIPDVLYLIVTALVSGIVQSALISEDVPRATLITRFSKTVLMLLFSALTLTEIDVAREIVIRRVAGSRSPGRNIRFSG